MLQREGPSRSLRWAVSVLLSLGKLQQSRMLFHPRWGKAGGSRLTHPQPFMSSRGTLEEVALLLSMALRGWERRLDTNLPSLALLLKVLIDCL